MAGKAHHDSDENSIDRQEKSITFYPRGLNIVWGADTRYWRIPSDNEKTNPAELIQVSWLEVTGSTVLDAGFKYKIYFVLSLKSDAFGWNGCQVYFMAKVGKKGRYKWTKVSFKEQSTPNQIFNVPGDEFVIDQVLASAEEDRRLHFGLYEVWSGKWKGGLQIHKAIVEKLEAK